jgi:uncharacterized tellurite resistance protein B-like protein
MNVQVTWQDLQYGREKDLYARLRPVLEDLAGKYKAFSEKTYIQEREFFKYLSHAVKIDKLPNVSELITDINQTLNTDFQLSLFMFQSPVANAMCLPRYGIGQRKEEEDTKELVILVSQHFMNELTYPEQLSVLGHELGHLLYGHVHIPAKTILESKFDLKDVKDAKINVLRWMICTEVSCDIIGFLTCHRDKDVFFQTMLKYATGLSTPVLQDAADYMFDLVLAQFDELSTSMFDAVLTTHPLTPLRLRIIQSVTDSDLINHFGQTIDQQELIAYKEEFDDIIDNEIRQIYPEMIPSTSGEADECLFKLCVAVALADGKITPDEVEAIKKIVEQKGKFDTSFINRVKKDKRPINQIIENVVREGVEDVKQCGKSRIEIVGMLRKLLIIAASDGRVDRSELDTIYSFAKEFDISKQELIFLLQQLGVM